MDVDQWKRDGQSGPRVFERLEPVRVPGNHVSYQLRLGIKLYPLLTLGGRLVQRKTSPCASLDTVSSVCSLTNPGVLFRLVDRVGRGCGRCR